MGYFKIIVPVGEMITNYVLNPSAETTGNFGGNGIPVSVARDTAYAFKGRYSYKIVNAAAANCAMYVTLPALNNAIHYITFWSLDTLGDAYSAGFYTAAPALIGSVTPALLNTEGVWRQYGVQVPAATAFGATGAVTCYIYNTSLSRTWYVDCIQVEQLSTWTTYIDGDEPGCRWSGTRHGSFSVRDVNTRSGGYVKDLMDDYSVKVINFSGQGPAPHQQAAISRSALDGSMWQRTRVLERTLQLGCSIEGSSLSDYHSKRNAFFNTIQMDLVDPQQPFILRYTGAGRTVEIPAVYDGGMEGGQMIGPCSEVFPVRAIAFDEPYWTELAQDSATIYNNATLAVEQMVAYLPDSQPWNATTGYWSALGAPEMVDAAHGDETDPQYIYAMAMDKAGNLYVGGYFLNLNGVAAADYIAKRDVNGTWSALGSGTGGLVLAIACDQAGNVYVGGAFTDLTDASGDNISMWNGTGWVSLGSGGGTNSVNNICIASNGTVYVGTAGSNIGGVPEADYIAKWSSGAWSALHATPPDSDVIAICENLDGLIYAGGLFTSVGGISASKIAVYYPTTATWTAVGAGCNSTVRALAAGPDGRIYAGGQFTTAGGIAASHIAVWDGAAWKPLGAGVNGTVWDIRVDSAGRVHVAGAFTSAGGISVADRYAIWNGTSWQAPGIDLPGSATVYALMTKGNDVYLGFDTEGDATISGVASATGRVINNGTAKAYPRVYVTRSGGTTATLQDFSNEGTKKKIGMNYALQDGETVCLDLRQGHKTFTSLTTGANLLNTVNPASDLATWCLTKGTNFVSAYCPGDATITVQLVWDIKHWSVDGGAR